MNFDRLQQFLNHNIIFINITIVVKKDDFLKTTIFLHTLIIIVTFKYLLMDVKYEGGKEYNGKILKYGL